MADFIPEESIFKFKNAFAAFESKKTGLIKVKQLGGVMRLATRFSLQKAFGGLWYWSLKCFRYLGQNPSEAELQVSSLSFLCGRVSYVCRTHNARVGVSHIFAEHTMKTICCLTQMFLEHRQADLGRQNLVWVRRIICRGSRSQIWGAHRCPITHLSEKDSVWKSWKTLHFEVEVTFVNLQTSIPSPFSNLQ